MRQSFPNLRHVPYQPSDGVLSPAVEQEPRNISMPETVHIGLVVPFSTGHYRDLIRGVRGLWEYQAPLDSHSLGSRGTLAQVATMPELCRTDLPGV